MIFTYSSFYYGHKITDDNKYFPFDEGAGELIAELSVGDYTLTDFASELQRALNVAAVDSFTVSVNRSTRIITISSAGTFKILGATGSVASTSCISLAGFALADTSFSTSHVGTSASGSVWEPQYKAQDYVDFEDNQQAVSGTVRKSASGKVESVRFGTEKIAEMSFPFITDYVMPSGHPILNDQSGVSSARLFMEYATTKAEMEFMPDSDRPDVFYKVILESTPEDKDGLDFKLKEQYQKGLVGYFDTGLLKLRLVED